MIYELLDRAAARAADDQPALMTARVEWDRLAGVVHDDEPLFEERAAAFFEWFLIDWRSVAGGVPPVVAQLADPAGPERPLLAALATSHRSLFQVLEALPDGVLLDDLWGGATFRVRERRNLAGLHRGELFEGRLAADPQAAPDVIFLRTFCFHPRSADEAIRTLIEEARSAGEARSAVLFRLLRLRLRCERYKHVPPARVYGEALGSGTRA